VSDGHVRAGGRLPGDRPRKWLPGGGLSFAKTASGSPGERPYWSDRPERLETSTRQRFSALCYAKISSDSRRNVRHRSS
jgi:hypothetical protein